MFHPSSLIPLLDSTPGPQLPHCSPSAPISEPRHPNLQPPCLYLPSFSPQALFLHTFSLSCCLFPANFSRLGQTNRFLCQKEGSRGRRRYSSSQHRSPHPRCAQHPPPFRPCRLRQPLLALHPKLLLPDLSISLQSFVSHTHRFGNGEVMMTDLCVEGDKRSLASESSCMESRGFETDW